MFDLFDWTCFGNRRRGWRYIKNWSSIASTFRAAAMILGDEFLAVNYVR